MANESIYRAFEREHEHITLALNNLQTTTQQYVDDKIASDGGGEYTKHCWRKKGYSIPIHGYSHYPYSSTTIAFTAATYSNYLNIYVSRELAGNGSLDISSSSSSYRRFTLTTRQDPTDYTYYDWELTFDTEDEFTRIDELINYLNTQADHYGIYVKFSHVMNSSMSGLNSTALYYFDQNNSFNFENAVLQSSTSSPSYYFDTLYVNSPKTVKWEVVDTDDTYTHVDEILYTNSADTYTPGDNGAGLIYTYLGIPKDTVPKGAAYGQHCWRKRGYSFPILNISYTTKTNALKIANTASIAIGDTMQLYAGYAVTINSNNKPVITSPRIFTLQYRSTTDEYGDYYNKFEVLSDSWDELKRPSELTLTNVVAELQRMAQNKDAVYISNNKDLSTSVYRITKSQTNNIKVYINDWDSVASRGYDYITLETSYSQVSVTQTGTNTNYVGVDEIIYSNQYTDITPGDNGAGLIYTYLGVPAEYMPRTSIQGGSYKGTGSSSGVSVAFNSLPPASEPPKSLTPASLTFGHKPQFIHLYTAGSTTATLVLEINDAMTGKYVQITSLGSGASLNYVYFKWQGNTLYWYARTASAASNNPYYFSNSVYNVSGTQYSWIAIGDQ